ncbi:four-helix bundle copper-binding protein [Clostridiaceae bacterium 35-E11]
MPERLPQYPSPYYGGYYPTPYTNPGHQANLVDTIQKCEETCEHMTTFLKRKADVHQRKRQLQLLRDCADICTLTAKYIARNSGFSRCIANLCAYICETCGIECAKFPDPESQNCAQICLHCARECRAFAMT